MAGIRGLVELGLRANDLEPMVTFYRDVVGLDIYDSSPGLVFLRIAEAVEGHPQLLAIFDRSVDVGQERTTLDHFAFLIDVDDYDAHKTRLESSGVEVFPKTFPAHRWRSLFFSDPEGNTVELVSYDPSV
ncbi:MAG: VOC family protein [Candidatus Binatia bacterium]